MVEAFHKAMGIPVRRTPTMPSEAERLMRARLVYEEANEVVRALGCKVSYGLDGRDVVIDHGVLVSRVDIAHELSDLLYVAHGGLAEMGAPPEVFAEVHRANMSKLDDDGKPVFREDGKVMKGPNYRPPDVAGVLARAANRVPQLILMCECTGVPHRWENGCPDTGGAP